MAHERSNFTEELAGLDKVDLLDLEKDLDIEILDIKSLISRITYEQPHKSDDEKEVLCARLSRKINFLAAKKHAVKAEISKINWIDKKNAREDAMEKVKLGIYQMAVLNVLGKDQAMLVKAEYIKLREQSETIQNARKAYLPKDKKL